MALAIRGFVWRDQHGDESLFLGKMADGSIKVAFARRGQMKNLTQFHGFAEFQGPYSEMLKLSFSRHGQEDRVCGPLLLRRIEHPFGLDRYECPQRPGLTMIPTFYWVTPAFQVGAKALAESFEVKVVVDFLHETDNPWRTASSSSSTLCGGPSARASGTTRWTASRSGCWRTSKS